MPSINSGGVWLSVVAGCSAALSSVFGKLAFDSTIIPKWINLVTNLISVSVEDTDLSYLILALRGFSFVMIFLTNIIMISLFVKSMNLSTSSEAVVVNTACNFFFTAFFGWLLFNEPLPSQWWVGAMLIVSGVLVIVKFSNSSEPKTEKNKKD